MAAETRELTIPFGFTRESSVTIRLRRAPG